MVKLLDAEVSRASFALRLVSGTVIASIAFLLLFLVPSNFTSLVGILMGVELPPSVVGSISSLVDPNLPKLGLSMVPVVFLNSLLKGTKAQGHFTVALSLLSIAYISLAFHGGKVSLEIPPSLTIGHLSSVQPCTLCVNLYTVMVLFMIPQLLGLSKGLLLIARRKD